MLPHPRLVLPSQLPPRRWDLRTGPKAWAQAGMGPGEGWLGKDLAGWLFIARVPFVLSLGVASTYLLRPFACVLHTHELVRTLPMALAVDADPAPGGP